MSHVEGIYEFSKRNKVYLASRLQSVSQYKQLLLITILFSLASCIGKNNIEVTLKHPKKTTTESLNITVSNVQVINHQIVITGTNLTAVSTFKIKEGSSNASLQIVSQSSRSIVANTLTNVTFAAGKVFDFVFSSAQAATTFTVNFSLCDSTLGGKGFNCAITPNDKEVLSFDALSGKWKPRSMNGISYRGTWDATGGAPATTTPGDYYIVSVAGAGYAVGDWTVCRATGVFDKINNSTVITNVFGRTGAVVATKGDYTLTKMADVDLTTNEPNPGEVLQYDGTNWVPGVVSAGAGGAVATVTGSAPIVVTNNSLAPVVSIPPATGSANGYLSSADWTTFNGKQTNITAGAGGLLDYYRGDKTFQTLNTTVVPEGTNKYFTNARVLDLALTGFDNTLTGQITGADNLVQAFGKTQKQMNSLTAGGSSYVSTAGGSILAGTTTLSGVIDATVTGGIRVGAPTGGTSAVSQTYVDAVDVLKLNKSGDVMSGLLTLDADLKIKGTTNYVTLKANSSTTTYNFSLPIDGGASGQVLSTNGSGVTSWVALPSAPGSITTNLQGGVVVNPFNTAPGNTGEIQLKELAANGSEYVSLKSPDALAANIAFILPATVGSSGQVLTTDGSNPASLSWSTPATTGTTLVGDISGTLVTNSIGTNKVTSTHILDGTIANADINGAAAIDYSKLNVPALAIPLTALNATGTKDSTKYLKGDNTWATLASDLLSSVIAGITFATNSAITASDTMLIAFGKLQTQITSLGSTKLDKTGGTLSVGTINGVPLPVNPDDIVNKSYADLRLPLAGGTMTGGLTVTQSGAGYAASFSGGNVGIGTTSPSVSLDVDGIMRIAKNASAPAICSAGIDGALALTSIYTTCVCKNGTGWVSTSDGTTTCGWSGASLSISATSGSASAMNVTGVTQGTPANGTTATFTLSNTGGATSGTVTIGLSNTTNFSVTGGTCISGSTTLAASGSCTIIVTPKDTLNESFSGNLNITANNNPTIALSGTASGFIADDCIGTPTPGAVCAGGAIYLGSLSPGATSGSGTNKYMTTPGGCGEIPTGQKTAGVNTPGGDYPNADFTPTCSGTDSLTKSWNDGSGNWAVVAGLTDYTTTGGVGNGAINTDISYGSANTTNIAAVTAAGSGGYHAAARYCDRLNYGGYTDWYLPNRYELNLMWTNGASIPGLDTTGNWYWSSTEYNYASPAWIQRFSDGYENYNYKNFLYRVRCVRRF